MVPVYNHPARLRSLVAALRIHSLPVLLVDDGSSDDCRALIDGLAQADHVHCLRHASNRGKGAAIMSGLTWARAQGFSHALQIDADYQHEPSDIPRFLDAARQHPQALVCGLPAFSSDMPRTRRYARYLTHVWVWINTLSLDIRDSMCGFRIYPVAACCDLIARQRMGPRMSFDTEIVVRYHWQGGQIVGVPTPVRYPPGGVSHFRMLEDNLRLSHMHARLFCGMLLRAPQLVWRRLQSSARRLP